MLDFFRRHKALNIVVVIVYFLLVVLPHEWVGLLTVDVFGGLTRDAYNALILGISLVGLGLYAIPVVRNILTKPNQQTTLFYLILSTVLSVVIFKTLIVINIEVVHFVQYGVMALLLYPLTMSYFQTLCFATILGALDEAYQYFYLAPQRTDYYDFNDVVINLIGASFGLIFIRSFQQEKITSLKISPFLVLCFLCIFGLIAAYAVGIVPIYPMGEIPESLWLLVKKVPEGFWSVVHPNVKYHVVLPLEGTLLTGILLLIYSRL